MMTITRGRCANVDYCELAATRVDVEVPLGAPFVCPECTKTLRQPPADQPFGRMQDTLVALGVAAALVCTGIAADRFLFPPGGVPTQAARVAVLPAAPAEPGVQKPAIILRLQGAPLLAAGLAPKLAAAFLAAQGDTGITTGPDETPGATIVRGLRAGRPEAVLIGAAGSDAAFAALEAGAIQVAMSSRRMTAPEQARLRPGGTDAGGHAVALAVPAVIVNPTNAVSALTVETLSSVLDGSISTWMPLGGSVEPIHLLTSSEQAEAAAGNGTHPLSDAVMRDEDSIAVVPLPKAGGAKVLAIGAPGLQPTPPSQAAVEGMTYPLAHPLYFYAPGTPQNRLGQLLVAFALSPAGQALVPQAGLVPLPSPKPAPLTAQAPTPSPLQASAPAKAPAPVPPPAAIATAADPAPWTLYRSLPASARLLAPGLHFEGETETLDASAQRDARRALGLITAAKTPPGHVVLASFAAGQGSPEQDLAASRAAADAVAAWLTKAGAPPGHILALGEGSAEKPVHGRRRWVEMYVLK